MNRNNEVPLHEIRRRDAKIEATQASVPIELEPIKAETLEVHRNGATHNGDLTIQELIGLQDR